MKPVPGLRRLFRLAAGRSTASADVAEELDLHVALRTEELMADGMSADLARAEALRCFGNVAEIHRTVTAIDREQERAMRRSEWLDSIVGDFRHALRSLRRSPGFALGTALTLGLGIGLNTAVFSVFDGVLLRPLPFTEPDRLVRIWSTQAERGLRFFSVSVADFQTWKAQNRSFERLASFERQQDVTLLGEGEPERIQGARVSAEIFSLLGVKPARGRLFTAEEDHPGSPARSLLLSHSLWRRRFGEDTGVVGRVLSLNGEPWTVVGVMPKDFVLPSNPAEVWMPLGLATAPSPRDGGRNLRVLGRLKPGVTVGMAREDLLTVARRIEAEDPANHTGWTVTVLGLTDAVVGESFGTALAILLGAVGIVFLIACVNVSTMVLARSTIRARELAVRTALGAGRQRLARLLLAEGLSLGVIGGVIGVFLAFAMVRLLLAVAPPNLPRLDQVSVNGMVLALAAALAVGSGVVFGLVPLRRSSRVSLTQSLREGGRGVSVGRSRVRSQRLLVVSEMMLAVLLLSGAGLMIRSLIRLQGVDLGFDAPRTLAVQLALPRGDYPGFGAVPFYDALLERVRSLPGAVGAAAISVVPLDGPNSGTNFRVDGRPAPDPGNLPDADYRSVTAGYFRLMNIPLREGRDFSARDDSAGVPVIVISATTARRYFPGGSPVGERVRLGNDGTGTPFEIIGVVGDVRHLSPETPEHRPMMYFAHTQTAVRGMTVLLATTGMPADLLPLVRREIHALDPSLPVAWAGTMDEVVGLAFAQRRFNVVVLGLFALAALALAGIGLYGVMAYTVNQRTHELGVRLALGAQRQEVVRMVLRESFTLVAGGVVLGLGGALLLNRLLSTLLFEIKPSDPVSLLGASVLLAGIALLGSFVPARRAARVDPMTTLRQE